MESPSPQLATVTGIILDPHWSGRTFNIPDCPSKNLAGSLKEWYTRNICPSVPTSALVIVRQDNTLINDDCTFWQLAEGEGRFTVSMLHAPLEPLQINTSQDTPITLYIQHDTMGFSTSVELPLKATLNQLKIAAYEQLGLGDETAALEPKVGFVFNGVQLDNEATLTMSGLSHGDHLYIGEHVTPPSAQKLSRNTTPNSPEQISSIAAIWAAPQGDAEIQALTTDLTAQLDLGLCSGFPVVDQPTTNPQRNRNNGKGNGNGNGNGNGKNKQQPDVERMKASYRTKMCRSGLNKCKYGHSCWFAHNARELRKPCDPLPPQCPGVNKLEKYARRQDPP